MEKLKCGAIKKRTGEPCKNMPMENGKCRLHGGLSTGPKDKEKHRESLKGNKNALSTGEYEMISSDTLLEDEKALFELVPDDMEKVLREDMKFLIVRRRRMLQIHTEAYSEPERDLDHIVQSENALSRINSRIVELSREVREIEASKPDGGEDGSSLHLLTESMGNMRNNREKELKLVEWENALLELERKLNERGSV